MSKTKLSTHWKQIDGTFIKISDMTDNHLSNALKMLGRTWKEKVSSNKQFKSLQVEALNRGFIIYTYDFPTLVNNIQEYMDVLIPTPRSQISSTIMPTDWDSRSII